MPSPSIVLSLSDGVAWTLAAASADDRAPTIPIPATVPGCVHTDLLRVGAIPDPFVDANELDVAWVAEVDWCYATTFVVSSAMLAHERVDIVFEGLDTLATITLNGVVVARTANMHRAYRFDIREAVRLGDNDLTIAFASATRRADELRALAAPWPSASFGRPFNYIRKMACSWGWDWGPWLTTAGVWRDARIECRRGPRLATVQPTARPDERGGGTVSVVIAMGDERATSGDRQVDEAMSIAVRLSDPAGRECASATTNVATTVTIDLAIDHVETWWPHTYGQQPLYRLAITLADRDGVPIDRWEKQIGFRTIVLDTTPDAVGSAFTFVVNEMPVFARGVNWIPESPFPSSITNAQVRERLQQAKDANVDVIRVWGGGLYESDAFYDACDQLGLMVWQDFCFACASYPEELLAAEVAAEARDNITRLMPHPSLVLWNGNNENVWGWFDWGWQTELDGRPWGAGFYFDLLPTVIAEIDPDRPYWPGSPYSGSMTVAPNADAHGCTHVWDVWNQLDFDRYRDHSPRFVAEFGWQAPPTWTTLRGSISDDPLRPDSPGMLHHQKAAHGNAKLARGLRAHTGVPAEFEAWWWATQLMQARAVTTGIEHFRSLRGTCMGTIWWQLNDCWPVTSWALIDAGGRRKPAWFALRDAYRARLLTVQPRGRELVLFAVNETADRWTVDAVARRIRFSGETLAEHRLDVDVASGALSAMRLPAAITTATDPSSELVVVDARGERAMWWFAPDKELALEPPRVTVESATSRVGDLVLTISTVNLVRDLTIMPDRVVADAQCDQQLNTLLPGETTTIIISRGAAIDAERLITGPALQSAHSALERPRR